MIGRMKSGLKMKYNLSKYDFINIELDATRFVAIIIKNTKSKLILLPILDFENPESISDDKIMTGISISKKSITAYHKLSDEQVQNILYLLNVNNTWIRAAIKRALNE
jgi:hypothetical protein